jgi:hypothetical protein
MDIKVKKIKISYYNAKCYLKLFERLKTRNIAQYVHHLSFTTGFGYMNESSSSSESD